MCSVWLCMHAMRFMCDGFEFNILLICIGNVYLMPCVWVLCQSMKSQTNNQPLPFTGSIWKSWYLLTSLAQDCRSKHSLQAEWCMKAYWTGWFDRYVTDLVAFAPHSARLTICGHCARIMIYYINVKNKTYKPRIYNKNTYKTSNIQKFHELEMFLMTCFELQCHC